MRNTALNSLVLSLFLVSNSALAATAKDELAKRLGASQMTEIKFDPSSKELKKGELKHLKAALDEAAKKGKVTALKLLVWSDKEYPASDTKQDDKDVGLAKDRIKELKAQVKKELKVWDIGTYNMAERPNNLEKTFATQDAQIKNTAENSGVAPSTKEDLGVFDQNGHASHAVILIYTQK